MEHEVAQYTQGNLSIQEYHSEFITLWTEFTGIAYANATGDILSRIWNSHKVNQRNQFLMNYGLNLKMLDPI